MVASGSRRFPGGLPGCAQQLALQLREGRRPGTVALEGVSTQQLQMPGVDGDDGIRQQLQAATESIATRLDGPEASVTKRLLEMSRDDELTCREIGREQLALAKGLESSEGATACHLRALLYESGGDDERALRDFRQALDRYRSEQSPLLPLCACDFAAFAVRSPLVVPEAVEIMDEYAIPKAKTLPLLIDAYCTKAALLRLDGDVIPTASMPLTSKGHLGTDRNAAVRSASTGIGTSTRLAGAKLALDRAEQLASQVKVGEGYALHWRILEEKAALVRSEWDLGAARSLWEEAISRRKVFLRRFQRSPTYRFALIHDCAELAETRQMLGQPELASSILRDLLDMTSGVKMPQADWTVTARETSQLTLLKPRLLVEMGDFHLCGVNYDYECACDYYEDAIRGLRDQRAPRHVVLSGCYRLAVAQSLAGRDKDAAETLAAADASWEKYAKPARDSDSSETGEPAWRSRDWQDAVEFRVVARAIPHMRGGSEQQQRQARDELEELAGWDVLDLERVPVRLLAAQLLLEDTRCETKRTMRIVDRVAQLIGACCGKLGVDQRGYFRRIARVAHFAGQQARQTMDQEDVPQQFQQALVVLEKAHRVSLASSTTATPAVSQASRLHSLAVGVSRYEYHSADHPLNLRSANSDAEDLHRAFQCLRRKDEQGNPNPWGIYGASELSCVLTDQRATRTAILQFVEDLRRLPAADLRKDLVVISLSGHGVQDLDRSLYFLPYDYRPGSLLSTGLSVDLFQSKLRMLGANVLLIIDTCYSGAARESHEQLTLRTTNDDINLALRRMAESETALAVLVAGKASEKAGESQLFGGHGALTAAVLEFLTQRQFDVETKGHVRPVSLRGNSGQDVLTLEDLRRYVIDRVAQFPLIDQRPNMYASGDRIGDYWCGDIPLRLVPTAGAQ